MLALRIIHKITTSLVLLVGVVHTFGTFYFFESLSERAIWFAGAGLAGIFVALLNIGLWGETPQPRPRWPTDLANTLFLVWLVSGSAAVPGAQAFVFAAIGVVMALTGVLLPRQPYDHRRGAT